MGSSLPWISLSRVQVSGVLEVQNKIDENCEIDESYQKDPKALFFMPVSGQVNKVQVRGKLEVQSEIIIDERYPETANLPSMPTRGQLNKVQVSGQLEIQNRISIGESCPNSFQASIQTLSKAAQISPFNCPIFCSTYLKVFLQFPESIAFTLLLIITPLLVLCPIYPPAICMSYLSKATLCDLTS